MVLLDTCTAFCSTLKETFGEKIGEVIIVVAGFALAWIKSRKSEKKAEAAQAEAATTRIQLAELKGSLRPAAMSIPNPAFQIVPAPPLVPADAVPEPVDTSDRVTPPLPRGTGGGEQA